VDESKLHDLQTQDSIIRAATKNDAYTISRLEFTRVNAKGTCHEASTPCEYLQQCEIALTLTVRCITRVRPVSHWCECAASIRGEYSCGRFPPSVHTDANLSARVNSLCKRTTRAFSRVNWMC